MYHPGSTHLPRLLYAGKGWRHDIFTWTRFTAHIVFPLLLMFLAACGGSSGSPAAGTTSNDGSTTSPVSPCVDGSGPKTLCEVQLSPTTASIALGARLQLSATAIYSDTSKEDVTVASEWSSSNSASASVTDGVNDKGSVLGLAPGSVTITARYNDKQTSITLDVTRAQLLSIELTQQNISLPVGSQTTVRALGRYSNNTIYDISRVVTWSVNDAALAMINSENEVTLVGTASGSTTLHASYDGVATSTALTITAAILDDIAIDPGAVSVALGTSASLAAIGYYSDGSVADITDQVTWLTLDESIAVLESSVGKGRRVAAKALGQTTLRASFAGLTADVPVSVTDAVLTELMLTPPLTSIVKGGKVQLSASAVYSDYSTRDVTSQVTWATSDSAVATIDNAADTSGLLTAINTGSIDFGATLDGIVVSQTLQVTDAQLIGLTITPTSASIATGTQLALQATANYADGSVEDITPFADWSISDTAIATVSQNEEGAIELKGLQAGSTVVVAAYLGKTASTPLTVTSAVLTAITIDSADLTLAKGTSARLTVTGHYSDATTADVSNAIIWTSTQSEIASISAIGKASGTVNAKAMGVTNITATLNDAAALTDTLSVTVTDAVLESLIINGVATSIPNKAVTQLHVEGQFSDATTQDLTDDVTWLSSAPDIAQVSNVTGTKGLVFGVASAVTGDGTAQISATMNTAAGLVEAVRTITVTYEPQRPVNITLRATPNTILSNGVDSTTVQTYLQAAESGAVVADGSLVDYEIIAGTGVLSASAAASMGGAAEISLRSNSNSVIVIKATIRDAGISNYVVVVATDSFASIILKYVSAEYSYDSATNIVQPNSRFYLYLRNLSNRDFTLEQYQFLDGATVLITVTDFDLVDNRLDSSAIYGVRLNVQPQLTNDGLVARFTLRDSASGQSFVVSHTYVLTP